MFDPSKLNLDLNNSEKENNLEENIKRKADKAEEVKENKTEKVSESKNEEITKTKNETVETSEIQNTIEDDNSFMKEEKLDTQDILDALDSSQRNDKKQGNEVKEVDESQIGRTEYEKSITPTPIKKENNPEEKKDEKIIFDINLTSLDILLKILIEKEYDFATLEPSEDKVKVIFRKDKVVKETKYIKYPVYSTILIKTKTISNLTVEETENQQEGSGETRVKDKSYKLITKVVPSSFGSKLFVKVKEIEKKLEKKESKKVSLAKIFTFLGIITFIALVIGGAFLSFIVINAKTVDDVKFFASLGINLNDINNFILRSVTIIFSILIFIETIFLTIYLFKFALTKKEFRQKKIRYGIISALILIVAFTSGSAWMIIDKKIRSLPKWEEMALGDIQIYDNSKLLSESFNKTSALLSDTSNLIGPVEIKFDLSYFAENEERKGLIIKKYIWDFGNDEIKETPIPTIIHSFKEKGNYEVKLTLEEVDLQGEITEKVVENIPNINVSYVVKINEKRLNNGGKLVDFDASSLKELGKIEWFFIDNLEEPVWTGDIFRVGKPIFEETLVGMYIKRNDKESNELDKLFIINGDDETNLSGKITYNRSLINDLEVELKVENAEVDFGNGYIEEYKWIIGDKEITKQGNVTDPVEASKITYEFDSYGEQEVKVILKDSAGTTKELNEIVDIPKILKLSRSLRILNEGTLLTDKELKYEEKLNEYYINEIGVPTELSLDARFLKSNNLLYTLKKVSWDYNSDGDIDEVTKLGKYNVSIEGNHTITAIYEFVNRKIEDDIITLKEKIYIEGIKKEAILKFDINKDSTYVPVTVSFDASKSQVKNENIEKFIWDYGDGVSEERDAIVPGHKYSVPGDYKITLKVVTTSGKEFTTSQILVLKPKPQTVKISTSMKKAPVGQGIDFTSEESEGQIVGYFWDFGDGNTSTQANPTHLYNKAGKYKVTLRIDFANKNVLEDTLDIEIYEE